MKKIIYIILFGQLSLAFGQSDAPASPYYDGFNFNQSGQSLKNDLATKLIAMHTRELTYQDAEDAIKVVDRDPEDATNQNVFLIYGFSENKCPENSLDYIEHKRRNRFDDGVNFCQWNREHTYPRSLGNPDLGSFFAGADAHHLRACDVAKNSNRGNRKFTSGSGNSGNVGSFWYPGDEWKGDIARMMMYMYLHYGQQCLPINVGVGNTVANDSNMVDLFLQWNAEDPVSELEDRRNAYLGNADTLYGQGNRNPFIDNPYLATLIWGGPNAENRWPSLSTSYFDAFATVTIFPNPSQDKTITVVSENNLDSIQLINLNGQIIQEIKQPNKTNNRHVFQNLSSGFYLVKLISKNQSVTKKVIVN